MPVLTVVVPLYNKALYVERCLHSIQAQSFADFEAVVVDDGSTDHSADIALQIVGDDPRFRIIVQPNRGEGAARNRGIAEARTGLVAFLDADDEWEPSFLEAITGLAQQFPKAGILATGYRRRFADRPDKETTLGGSSRKLIHDYFRRSKNADIIYPSAAAVPHRVLQEVGGFAEGLPIGCDRDLWARIALQYPVAHDSRILAQYHSEATGRVSDSYAHAIPFPMVVRSLRAALARGSVSGDEISDVKTYIDHVLMQYADALLYHHRRSELARFLSEDHFQSGRYRLQAFLLRCALPFLPMRALHALKWKPLLLLRRIRQAFVLRGRTQIWRLTD